MNKKQAGIILGLIALIALAGVASVKINGPVQEIAGNEWNIGKPTANLENENAESDDYFNNARLDKEKKDSEILQTLSNIVNNENVSKEKRDEAAKKQAALALKNEYEGRIEISLKGKGFEDILCLIQDDNSAVNVIVKAKDQLDENQRKQIQETVVGTCKIKNVEVETRE